MTVTLRFPNFRDLAVMGLNVLYLRLLAAEAGIFITLACAYVCARGCVCTYMGVHIGVSIACLISSFIPLLHKTGFDIYNQAP